MACNTSLLPSGYKQVEYIRSTGTQYINSGLLSSLTLGIEMDVKFDAYGDGLCGTLIYPRYALGTHNSLGLIYLRGNTYASNIIGYQPLLDTKYKLRFNYENSMNICLLDENGVLLGNLYNIPSETVSNGDFNILANTTNGTTYYYYKAKLYRAKMTSGVTLVRDFVPCVQMSDNSVGMFDLVSRTFFGSAGSEDFFAGPDV